MKKLISVWLAFMLVLGLCGTVLARSDAGSEELDSPGSVGVDVVLSAEVPSGRYVGEEKDGVVDVSGPGFTAHAEQIPDGTVRLVVVPITQREPLEWFDSCVGPHWTPIGTIYAVFYEDADGNRIDAPGVRMTVQVPGGYDSLNVFSVSTDEHATALDYVSDETSVRFTTDGSLYCGIVHKQGVVEEETVVGSGAPNVSLDMTPEAVAGAVLTEEDQNCLDLGVDVRVQLTVNDITGTVGSAVVRAVEGVAGSYIVGEYVDIELRKQIGDRPWESIHETKQPIRITLQIPERLLGSAGREFAIVQVHGAAASFLRDLDSDPKTITFETSQFSVFAILYRDPSPTTPDAPDRPGTVKPTDTPATGPADAPTTGSTTSAAGTPGGQTAASPATGDGSHLPLWFMLMAASLLGLIIVLVRGNKRDVTSLKH